MVKKQIISLLKNLTSHNYFEILSRGNRAIDVSLSIFAENDTILVPEEGGWLHYKIAPKKLNLKFVEVSCNKAKIDLSDLMKKLENGNYVAFLYQNPGGYFAEQPLKEIYQICKKNKCLVILDVSGSIGTSLCNGDYADIIVGSFGKWKLVEAHVGGFISCNDNELWKKINIHFQKVILDNLNDKESLLKILQKLEELSSRIKFLLKKKEKIINDLKDLNIIYPKDLGFVTIVKFKDNNEKEKIIKYCENNSLNWTECPRYIRINEKAISIEIKRLS